MYKGEIMMFKRISSYYLIVIMILAMLPINVISLKAMDEIATTDIAFTDTSFKYYPQASKLSEVGVFVGTGSGFELNRAPNRLEALIVMIRLLGAEQDALAMKNDPSVFSDVPAWGIGYTNYAYVKGLTKGLGNGVFGYDRLIRSNEYSTFMLRSLGYSDSVGDFTVEEANLFALEYHVISSEQYTELNTEDFLRNHMASLSYSTLTSTMKTPKITLNEYLVNIGKMSSSVNVFDLNNGDDTTTGDNTDDGTTGEDTSGNESQDDSTLNQLPLMGTTPIDAQQLKNWARSKGMSEEGVGLVDLYFEISIPKGLNPVIQYVQMCYETGWLYKVASGAGLDASYHNPCGLKTTVGGGDYETTAHMKFDSWYDGIDAHTDHSALYAGAPGYPKAVTKDPRHFAWIFGRASTVQQLSGNWAPSLTYHETILRLYNEAIAFK